VTALARARQAFDDVFDRPGDVRTLGLTRLLFGPVVILHLGPTFNEWRDGTVYSDRFHVPFWSWYPEPPRPLYVAVLLVGLVAGAAMTIGWRCRIATAVAFAVVLYNLLLDQTGFHHNRAFLTVVLGGLALLPTDRALSVDAWRARRRGRPLAPTATLWPLWLLRAMVASVYFASAASKLSNPSWRDGTVLFDRASRSRDELQHSPLPGALVDLFTARWFHSAFAPAAIATELFIAIGLWFPRTRYAAIWTAVVFHVAIEVGADVQVFSLAGLAALTIWVTARARDRSLALPLGSRLAPLVRSLDWTFRFECRPGPEVILVDRDGTVRTGSDATLTALMLLPALFFPVAPVVAISRGRRRARRRRAPDRPAPVGAASP
jgi:HTTM domain